jgi:hypothetical protein
MQAAIAGCMAAVLALIMLPLIAGVGFFIGVSHPEGSIAGASAGLVFIALAGFVLVNALRLARNAEGPEH